MSEEKKFKLILETLPNDNSKLAELKSAMLTTLGWDLDRAKNTLESLPCCIESSDIKENLQEIQELFQSLGATININGEEIKDEEFYEINLDDFIKEEPKEDPTPETEKQTNIEEVLPEIEFNFEDLKLETTTEEIEKELAPEKPIVQEEEKEILCTVEHMEEKAEEPVTEEDNGDICTILPEKSHEHDNFSVYKAETAVPTGFTNKNVVKNSVLSIALSLTIVVVSYLIFYSANTKDQTSALREQISLISEIDQTKAIVNDKRISPEIHYQSKFIIDNIKFTANLESREQEVIDLQMFSNDIIEQKEDQLSTLFSGEVEKITLGSVAINNHAEGHFMAKGVIKLYMNIDGKIVRPTANALFSGLVLPEENSFKVRLLINRGFKEIPEQSVININKKDPEATTIFVDEDIVFYQVK